MDDKELSQFKSIKSEIDDAFVLNEILQKINGNTEHIDIQINNLVILSSALFAFSAQGFLSVNGGNASSHLYLLVLALFSSVAAIAGLMALNPPGFMDKRGQKDSKLYVHGIFNHKTPEEYHMAVREMIGSKEKTVEQYALEIYNLSKFSYMPKRRLFNLSKDLLISGFAIGVILFLIQL